VSISILALKNYNGSRFYSI